MQRANPTWICCIVQSCFHSPPQHWEFDVKKDLQDVRMFHKMRSSTTFGNRDYQHWTMIDPLQVDENEPKEATPWKLIVEVIREHARPLNLAIVDY